MGLPNTRITDSEEKILAALRQNHGHMGLNALVESLRNAGIEDEFLIRSIIWKLIAQAQIERDADTLSLVER